MNIDVEFTISAITISDRPSYRSGKIYTPVKKQLNCKESGLESGLKIQSPTTGTAFKLRICAGSNPALPRFGVGAPPPT